MMLCGHPEYQAEINKFMDEVEKTLLGILGHTNASFTLNTYTHVTTDMQRQASVVGNFMEDIFGKELKPWQSEENGAKEAST